MKRILTTMILALALTVLGWSGNKASAQVNVGISYQNFYDELSPHGRWIDYPEYGYVWAPDLGPDFQPYRTGGQWVWSDEYDWMWVSDYSWGWAPFHYGRWFHDDYYGWMWMPGYEWSPAWVSWRTGGDYYGWAPLRPGISINIGFGNYNPPYNYWSFAPRRYINSGHINNYCVDRSRNVTIINNTTIINHYGNRNNVFVNGGPRRGDVERYTGRIRPVNFRETDRPGGRVYRNNNVRVYRPQIQRDNDRRFAPRNFDQYSRNNGNANNRINRNNSERRINDVNRGTNDRNFDRRPENNNTNVFDRRPGGSERNGQRNEGRVRNQENQQPEIDRRNNRRNVFDRPGTQQQNENTRTERQNVFDRRQNQSGDNDRRVNPNFERRNREMQQIERRNETNRIFQRNNQQGSQQERREFGNQNRSQQQSNPQAERPSRQFRQLENRGNDNQRGQRSDNNNNGGAGKKFERRHR